MKPVVAQRASYFEKKHSWKEETVKQKGNLTFFFPFTKSRQSVSIRAHKWTPDESEDISKCTTVTPPPQLSLLRALNNVHPNLNTYKST